MITSLWRQNDVATSFWRHNDVVISSCVHWVMSDISSLPKGCFSSDLILSHVSRVFNPLKPRQNGRHFINDIFKVIFLHENSCIWFQISMPYIRKGPINNQSSLAPKMNWRRTGDKPVPEPMYVYTLLCFWLDEDRYDHKDDNIKKPWVKITEFVHSFCSMRDLFYGVLSAMSKHRFRYWQNKQPIPLTMVTLFPCKYINTL